MMKHIIHLNLKMLRILHINLKVTEDVKEGNYEENNLKIQKNKIRIGKKKDWENQ